MTGVESGSHLLTHLTHWPTEQSGCDPHMTHLWPTCWSFLFKSSQCNMTKIFDMEQCHGFLHFGRIQNWSLALHLLTRCQHCFLKNMWYQGHIQIIWFVDETNLTLQKVTQVTRLSGSSDPLSTLIMTPKAGTFSTDVAQYTGLLLKWIKYLWGWLDARSEWNVQLYITMRALPTKN